MNAGIQAAEGTGFVVQAVIATVKATAAGVGKANLIADWDARIGISYRSGAGDYAEWLPKFDQRDDLLPGEIVGVSSGQVSRFTKVQTIYSWFQRVPSCLEMNPG